MKRFSIAVAAALLTAPLSAGEKPAAISPSEIVAAAPASEWVRIAAADLLVMDLAPGPKGAPRRVVIQLIPAPFSQGWVGNIRKLAATHWWDGLSVYRVQDNYVAQWGDAEGESKAKARALPAGLAVVPESEYVSRYTPAMFSRYAESGFTTVPGDAAEFFMDRPVRTEGRPPRFADPYTGNVSWAFGFPVGLKWWVERGAGGTIVKTGPDQVWPLHCYGMVGVARDLSPDTGTGAELYTVIGHAPRQLDRNIALVGRVVEGIQWLSSLPRGTGASGFYETPEERTAILSVRLASALPEAERPRFEYLSTESQSFVKYAEAIANRGDPFFIQPAGGADICNVRVPVRRSASSR
jgi:peptidylprolyl isomerase